MNTFSVETRRVRDEAAVLHAMDVKTGLAEKKSE